MVSTKYVTVWIMIGNILGGNLLIICQANIFGFVIWKLWPGIEVDQLPPKSFTIEKLKHFNQFKSSPPLTIGSQFQGKEERSV